MNPRGSRKRGIPTQSLRRTKDEEVKSVDKILSQVSGLQGVLSEVCFDPILPPKGIVLYNSLSGVARLKFISTVTNLFFGEIIPKPLLTNIILARRMFESQNKTVIK